MTQSIITIALVIGAAGYVALRLTRALRLARRARGAACGDGCGCAPER